MGGLRTVEDLVAAVEAARPRPSVGIASMSAVAPFVAAGLTPLDFAHLPSSMGQTVPLALGVALGRPDLPVVALVGDGSLLMNLGTLATCTRAAAHNLYLVVVDNGAYAVTGGQRHVGTDRVDLVQVARGCGLRAARCGPTDDATEALDRWFAHPGPALLAVEVDRARPVPPAREPGPARERFQAWRAKLSLGRPQAGDEGARGT